MTLALSLLFFHLPRLDAASTNEDGIVQQELKQQQLKGTTKRVQEQLDVVIGEFERNVISGPDVVVLKSIRSVLGVLTDEDMRLVLEYLQKSREAEDPTASAREATEAYARQKAIITKLKVLEAEYRRQAELYELSQRFKEFAARESRYMWQAVDLAKRTEGKTPGGFTEGQRSELKLLQIDQEPLLDEVKPNVGRLEKLSKEAIDGPTLERAQQAARQAQEGGWEAALNGAIRELQGGKLMSGASNQRRARDQFRDIARLLVLSQGEVESLRQAMRELEQAIDEQKEVMANTKRLENKDRDNKLALKQAEMVDGTDLIARDIESLAPVASEYLKGAMDKMQEARAALETEKDPAGQRDKAPPKQAEALAGMEQARKALQEQLTKAEEKGSKPENSLADLKDLQEEVKELAKQEQKLKDSAAATDPNDLAGKAPEQGELKDKAQEAQSKASAQTPVAAQALGDAAKQMQRSQSALANSQNDPAAQQAAIDALKKASQQIGDDISKLEQAQKDLAAVEDLQKKLSGVIKQQQGVQQDTAREAFKQEPSKDLGELADKQQSVAGETGQLQQEAVTAAPKAAPHLNTAQSSMTQAKGLLTRPDAKEAQSKESDALTELYAAKSELESKSEQLRNMLGMPQNSQKLMDAVAAIEKAQKNVGQAMQNLQQNPPPPENAMAQAAQQLMDANKIVAPLTAGEAGPLPNAAQSALQSAQSSLAKGSAQANAGKNAPAQESSSTAAQFLAQAQAALALAQAGLGSGQPMMAEGQGQGQGSNPAQGQGQGRGQKVMAQGVPGGKGTGQKGNWEGPGGTEGPVQHTTGAGQFTGLPMRDRAAIQQSQAEKYPQEYGPMVEQYLKNLSDQVDK